MLRFFTLWVWTRLLSLFIEAETVIEGMLLDYEKTKTEPKLFTLFFPFRWFGIASKHMRLSTASYELQGVHFGVNKYGYVFSVRQWQFFLENNGYTLGGFCNINAQKHDPDIKIYPQSSASKPWFCNYKVNQYPFARYTSYLMPEEEYILYWTFYDMLNKKSKLTFIECNLGADDIYTKLYQLHDVKTSKHFVYAEYKTGSFSFEAFEKYIDKLGYKFNEDLSIQMC